MKPNNKPNLKPNSHSGNNSSHSQNNPDSTQSKGSTYAQKEPTSDLPPKLGKEGKLTPQECQCHLGNKLCLFCGNSGHIAKDCLKAASFKACAAKTELENSMSSSSDPKKD